ncbi:hypothetical protein H2201_001629 [Coniosporium apollinis]|uniref:Metallo-beta-lactamase domain-containing protein n=1 Tax=Coniosporium apollinis TaxID=61459 RepID=A0ABQ9P3Q7_9PEZI|nr:hypothetical protein H2201_001629 [Coniosporium apollinis]
MLFSVVYGILAAAYASAAPQGPPASSTVNAPQYAPVPIGAFGPNLTAAGCRVEPFGGGAYMVTDNLYQALFLVSDEGVIVVDNPPTIGLNIIYAVGNVTDAPITHVVYSHAHADHIGVPSFCSPSHRAAAIIELEFDVILPAYSDDLCAKFESEKDKKANNEAFTNAIKRLFETLHSWENSGNDGADKKRGRPIILSLGAYSPTDPRFREAGARPGDLKEQRYEDSFLAVLNPDELPSIERIVRFVCCKGSRKMDAATAAAIASKFPALEGVYWDLEDAAFPGSFAQALSSFRPSNLKSFRLHFPFTEPRNENFVIPSAVPPTCSPNDDPLSSALYDVSLLPNLEIFSLSGPIAVSPALFEPAFSIAKNNTSDTSPPMYPKLQEFSLELSRTTPSGDWLFAGDPDNTDSDSDSASDSASDWHYESDSDEYGDYTYGDDVTDAITDDVPDESSPDTPSPSTHSPGASSNAPIHDPSGAYAHALAVGARPIRLFRKRIVPELFNPFVTAFSHALYRMPALHCSHLHVGEFSGRAAGVEVLAIGAGANGIWNHPAEEAARRRMRVTARKKSRWVIPAEVRGLWEQWVGEGGTLRINE